MNGNKICSKCGIEKQLSMFHKDKDKKDGLKTICKTCSITNVKKWQESSLKYKETYKNYYLKNKDNVKQWKKNNKGLVRASKTAYRLKKEKRQPSWLTKEQKQAIAEFYSIAKEFERIFLRKQEVDHIVPLNGKTVSGLHVPWNLRIITAKENLRKRNYWDWELQQ